MEKYRVGIALALLLTLLACAPRAPEETLSPGPTATPAPPSPVSAPPDPCAGIPTPTGGAIAPACGSAQAQFTMDIWGFQPDEHVGFWLDSWEHGTIAGTRETVSIGPSGSSEDLYFYPYEFDLQPGTYQWVFQGVASGHQAVLPFRVLP